MKFPATLSAFAHGDMPSQNELLWFCFSRSGLDCSGIHVTKFGFIQIEINISKDSCCFGFIYNFLYRDYLCRLSDIFNGVPPQADSLHFIVTDRHGHIIVPYRYSV